MTDQPHNLTDERVAEIRTYNRLELQRATRRAAFDRLRGQIPGE